MKELNFGDDKLKVKKGNLESMVRFPTGAESVDFAQSMTDDAKTNLEIYKKFYIQLGMSEELFDNLTQFEIAGVSKALRGDDQKN